MVLFHLEIQSAVHLINMYANFSTSSTYPSCDISTREEPALNGHLYFQRKLAIQGNGLTNLWNYMKD